MDLCVTVHIQALFAREGPGEHSVHTEIKKLQKLTRNILYSKIISAIQNALKLAKSNVNCRKIMVTGTYLGRIIEPIALTFELI